MCAGGGDGDSVDNVGGTTCGDVGGGDVCVLVEVVVTVFTMLVVLLVVMLVAAMCVCWWRWW